MTSLAQLRRRLDVLERERGPRGASGDTLDQQLNDAAARIGSAGDDVAALRGYDSFRQLLDRKPPATVDVDVDEIERASAAFIEFRNGLALGTPEHRALAGQFINQMTPADWNL
jgi:hypothetical protein